MARSRPRDLAPGGVLVRVGLAGQAEHPLTDDVSVHLAGAALDRVGAAPQHPLDLVRQRLEVRGGFALPRGRSRAEEVGAQQLQALVDLAAVHLADTALGPERTPGRGTRTDASVRPLADPLLRVQVGKSLPRDRLVRASELHRELDRVVDAGAADAVDTARTRACHHLPLRRQRRAGDPPTVTDRADALRVRHSRAIEEHLVEVLFTGDVAQRSDLDPPLVQIEQEVGDALALGHIGVGASEQHGEVGAVRPRRPHLLPVHDPLVAVAHRTRREGSQIRARTGLAEQLAPLLLVADDRRQEAAALLLGAVRVQRGGAQVEAERVQPAEVVRRELGLDPASGLDADIQAAVLDGPRRHHETGSAECRVPLLVLGAAAHGADLGATTPRCGLAPRPGDMRLDPLTDRHDDILFGRRRVDRDAASAPHHVWSAPLRRPGRPATAPLHLIMSGRLRSAVPAVRPRLRCTSSPLVASAPPSRPSGHGSAPPHRPSKSGARRSRIATMPALKSSLRDESSIANASFARWRSRSRPAPACTSHLVRPSATVGPAARRAASSRAAEATRSASTAEWISPQAAASSPDSSRPSISSSYARAMPTSRGSSHVPPLSGVKPRRANGSQNRASRAATQKSAATARWKPMPAAHPRTAQTTGTWTEHSSGTNRCACTGSRSWMLQTRGRASAGSLRLTRSNPEQKSSPSPLNRTARTCSSWFASSSCSMSAAIVASSSALRFDGRASVSASTAPSRRTSSEASATVTPGRSAR